MIQNLFFGVAHGRFVRVPYDLEILLVIETVTEDIPKAFQSSLEGICHSLLPCLLNAQRLLLMLNQNVTNKRPFLFTFDLIPSLTPYPISS